MNPFVELIRLAQHRGARPRPPARLPRELATTKVGALPGYLRAGGPASTATLCLLVDVDSRAVWGLLKAPRQRGQVRYERGMWSAVDDYDRELQLDISTAAALLRRHGWTVRPPRSGQPGAQT
jgi:hypothetical protein